MAFRKTYPLVIILGLVTLFSACAGGSSGVERINVIESRAPVGISEKEFNEKVPKAELLREDENQKIYIVAVEEPCLICNSFKAFQRSAEIYATSFTFENGRLIAMDRIMNGK